MVPELFCDFQDPTAIEIYNNSFNNLTVEMEFVAMYGARVCNMSKMTNQSILHGNHKGSMHSNHESKWWHESKFSISFCNIYVLDAELLQMDTFESYIEEKL